jgi:hypothetical protein
VAAVPKVPPHKLKKLSLSFSSSHKKVNIPLRPCLLHALPISSSFNYSS